jgi:diacylglycerol kinase family enzyme
MGGGGPARFDGTHVRAVVDLVRVTADGRELWALAHVVVRRRWWRGEVVLVMNAEFLGPYDVVPRSHPNDGRVDVVRVDPSMSVRARLQARRRARTGTHLPHPQLAVQSTATWHATFDRPLRLFVDGKRNGVVRDLRIEVVPDALTVHA